MTVIVKMATKTPKKKESKERVASAATKAVEQSMAPSVVGSLEDKSKKPKQPIIIWPEWSDQDINQEKWDVMHKAKEKDKGRSPNPHPYEDPEGRIELPQGMKSKVDHWKRPNDFIVDKAPVVISPKSLNEDIDLLSKNEHLTDCELMRWIIAQITTLWKLHFKIDIPEVKPKDAKDSKEKDRDKDKDKDKDAFVEDNFWKPWGHIWPKEKTKGNAMPVYNIGGKYCVKVYWLGTWRKIIVDDWMPFDEEGRLLLPSTPNDQELWPMLLSKALIKVASLDYAGGNSSCEFGDFTVVNALTGWLPEIIPLRNGQTSEIWKLLKQVLPHWRLDKTSPPEERKEQPTPEIKKDKDRKSTKSQKVAKPEEGHGDSKAKEPKGSTNLTSEQLSKEPELVIFASYLHQPNGSTQVSVLREMADASEKLRLSGLSHNHPHPVLVTTIRDCPLVAPPPPVEIPRWKLIRQMKKRQPIEPPLTPPEPPKDPQFLEIMSPFVKYNVSPIPVSRVRTPVKWMKFHPEKPMGEITEEGNKDEQDKEQNCDQNKRPTEETKDDVDSAPETSESKQDVEKNPPIKDRESHQSSKDVTKSPKERVKSAKSERADKSIKVDSVTKAKSGSKLNAGEKPEKTKSGPFSSPKSGRRMSRMERPGDLKGINSKDSRRISRMDRPSKAELEKDSPHEIFEVEENITLEVPPTTIVDEDSNEGEAGDDRQDGEKSGEPDKDINDKKLWMDFDDFCKCFSNLYIFHKPYTYKCTKSITELKNIATTTHGSSKKSGLQATSSVTAATPAPGKNTSLSPSPYYGTGGANNALEPPPPYLFVDSLNPIEIIISFTGFSKWLDPPMPIIRERDKDKDSTSSVSDLKEVITDEKPVPLVPGSLVGEPYSWKSLVTGQPCVRIRTTGTKSTVMCLPPGRHVLRFLLQAPHGYHAQLCSQTSFIFGEEDIVMTALTKESCRFVEHAMSVINSVGNLVASFSYPPVPNRPQLDLGLRNESLKTQELHFKVFMKCLFKALKYNLGEAYNEEMHFAWKAFAFQAALCVHQHIAHRPLSAADITRIGSLQRTSLAKMINEMPATWTDRASNSDEEKAAIKIQALFRGYFLRRLASAYVAGSEIQQQVSSILAKAWNTLEPNLENFAIEVFRRMFKKDAKLFPLFPFFKDEWSRVTYADYTGSYPEQPANSWFVVFREVFMVDEPVPMVPKLYINLPTCLLRVVDNDTGEELSRVFERVAPSQMKRNKGGYTFIAEARTLNAILPAGKFRLRVIGSTEPLPYSPRECVNSNFVHKEIRDYYIPNKYNVIFRHTVKVSDDHMTSIQLSTSKQDVYVKLQILDHEVEVASMTGKGHAVIPAFIFYRDRTGDEETDKHSRRGSRPPTSNRPRSGSKRPQSGRKAAFSAQGRTKKSGKDSSNSSRPTSPQKSSKSYLMDDDDRQEIHEEADADPEIKIHKYIIQAQVLRDSWPLSRSSWDFVQMIKNLDREDVVGPNELPSQRGEKLSASTSTKGKKSKEGKESRSSKDKPSSRPSSQQQFDSSKPNWILRVFSDANDEEIEVRKDTERQDEIKAMKQAWEAAEPGRAAKARQSRAKFLSEHMIKVDRDAIDENPDDEQLMDKEAPSDIFTVTSPVQSEAEGELTVVPPPKEPDQILKPLDPPRYIRSRGGFPVLLDEGEEDRRQKERQRMFRDYKARREEVESRREKERIDRNWTKEKQLQDAEEMQAALDKARQEICAAREKYRQKFVIAEKEEQTEAEKGKDRSPSPGRSKSMKSASTAGKAGRKSATKGKKK